MVKRTLFGHCANLVNIGLAAAGLTMSKLPERNTLERQLKTIFKNQKVDCVIDVGAHHGEFGQVLREIGYQGRVVSFEPSEVAFRRVSEISGRDSLWEVHRLCLGNGNGIAEIQKFRSTEFNSLHAPTAFAAASWYSGHMEPEGVESVPMRRLDSLLPELQIDPRKMNIYLKIDTQGHDVQVIQGASGFLSEVNAIQTELSALRLYEEVPTIGEALLYFRELGFLPAGFFAVPSSKNPAPIIEWDCVFTRVDPSFLEKDSISQKHT